MTALLHRPATVAERRMWLDGHAADMPYTYVETEHGLEVIIADEIPTAGPRLGDVDLDLVVHLLITVHGIPEAEVAMTGGGVGTIYAGKAEPIDDGRYTQPPVCAGPGTYVDKGGSATAVLHELSVGIDPEVYGSDDAPGTDFADAGAVTHTKIAALIALYGGLWHNVRRAPGNDDLEAIGLDGSLRSRPAWLIADEAKIAERIHAHNVRNRARLAQNAAASTYIVQPWEI